MAEQAIGEGMLTMDELRDSGVPEEQGYDAPFITFTWQHWMEAQAKVHQCFSHFVRAAGE